jgi:hypothetical protein
MIDKNWAISVHDEHVELHGAMPLSESRAMFAERFAHDVAAGIIKRSKRTVVQEGTAEFDRLILPLREKRRASMRHDFEYVADSLFGGGDGATIDPIMSCAYPTSTGHDKTLSAWTVEDLAMSVTNRYRGAAEQTAAAAEHDAAAQPLIDAMNRRGVATLGALFQIKAAA